MAGSPSEWTGRPALAERAVVTAVISGLRRAVGVFGKFVLPRGPITILVVDDDPIVLRATQDRLVRLGFRVQAELDPPSALRRLRHDSVQLALIDASLLGPTGDLLVAEACRCFSRHRIVLHSGWRAAELDALARQHRLLGFIQKTGDEAWMEQELERLLGESAQRLECSESTPPNVRCP